MRIAGGLPRAGWERMLEDSGFGDVRIRPPVDTFGGARGKANAPRLRRLRFFARKID